MIFHPHDLRLLFFWLNGLGISIAKHVKTFLERLPRSNMNRVAKNAVWIIGIKIVQSILAVLINMLTARYLGPFGFGLITYASSLVAFVSPIMQLGLNNVLVQEMVNDPESEGEILGTSIVFSLISSICCIVGVTSFAFVANPGEPETVIVCFLYSLILIFQACDYVQ